jgi:hypothetical protein
MKTLLKPITTLENRSATWACVALAMFALALCLVGTAMPAAAQTAGEGSIEGTVTDTTGAVIPHAAVTITNNATGIKTSIDASSAGFFTIAPVLPGTYTVQVVAKGFKTLVQDNVVVDALQVRAISPQLEVGAETQTVTVTAAPPVLDTADATLGLTMENATYTNLPIQMGSGLQRDPTAFGVLTPGAQNGPRLPVISGTGGYLGQLYLDGMPAETVSQQGDNRLISESMDLDSVDQFQMVTSTPPAEYMGAGAENFTMKSGGLKYHGQVSDFVRNTVFDSWCFTCKAATIKNSLGATVQAPKPWEHQNELSASGGGVVPKTGKKLFFFYAFDKYHYRAVVNPTLLTIPTTLMLQGNFTELTPTATYPNGNPVAGQTGTGANNPPFLYDPTTNSCSGSPLVCTRQPFQYNGTYNVIPPGDISPIAKAIEQYMPAPTNPGVLFNNYLGSIPTGKDNHVNNWRVDYDLSSKIRISSVGVMGTYGYLNNWGSPYLPFPYVGGDEADIYPKDYVLGITYTVTPNLVNQLKYSYTRFFQNIYDNTQGLTKYEVGTLGVSNLPAGQAGSEFPGSSFGTSSAFTNGDSSMGSNTSASNATQLTTPNNYAITDNVQWVRGKHSLTIGLTFQFENINNANPATASSVLGMSYNAYQTANFASGGSTLNTGGTGYAGTSTGPSGYSYASFLLGAVGSATSPSNGGTPSLTLQQAVSEEGGRYKTISPYVEDSYKITPKLTAVIGLRWDYLPPFHEVKNHWSFLNPTMTNPLISAPGMLEFAGSYGGPGASCNCKTPVQTYFKNFGPRVGLAYEWNPKTVFRAGFATVYSQGGGVGGRGGAFNGTGQTGFNSNAIGPAESLSGASAGPSYWLNGTSAYLGSSANTSLFGPGYAYPAAPTLGTTILTLQTGNFVCPSNGIGAGGAACTPGAVVGASTVSYADPYLAGRAPQLVMWNAGVERGLTKDLTLAINYVANESHFLLDYSGASNADSVTNRGYWLNQLDPKYLAILGPVTATTGGPLLNAQANAANIAQLLTYIPNAPTPAFYAAAGAVKSSITIAQMLVAFPQFSGVSDTFGNSDNFSYEALQITLLQRMAHGLNFNINYTFSKNIGDDTSFRSGFDIPMAAISHGTQNWHMDRIERSWTAISIPQNLKAFGVYQLPFGKGGFGSGNMLVRTLAGGWQISGIYQWASGTPVQVTWSACSSTNHPGQGTCMPDMNSAYLSSNAHQNGKYGSGPNGYNTCNLGINALGQSGCTAIQYLNPNGFAVPQNVSSNSTAQYLLGNAPRTAPYHLRNPYSWNLDSGVRRTFPIHESLQFVFEANALNTFNHVTFGTPSGTWAAGSTSFGTITSASGNRDWQFAGHLNF